MISALVSGRPQESRPLHSTNGSSSSAPPPLSASMPVSSGKGFPPSIKEELPIRQPTDSLQQSQQLPQQQNHHPAHSQSSSAHRQPNASSYSSHPNGSGKIIDSPRVIVSTRQPASTGSSSASTTLVSTTSTTTTTAKTTSVGDGHPNGPALMTAYSHRSLMSMGGEMATQYGTASMPNAHPPATKVRDAVVDWVQSLYLSLFMQARYQQRQASPQGYGSGPPPLHSQILPFRKYSSR